jgi:hypothetical protein
MLCRLFDLHGCGAGETLTMTSDTVVVRAGLTGAFNHRKAASYRSTARQALSRRQNALHGQAELMNVGKRRLNVHS